MSVTLTGPAGYFTRAGAFLGEFNRVCAQYGSALDAGFQSIWVQFVSSDQAAVQNLPDAVVGFRTTNSSYLQVIQADGQQAALLQVNDDSDVIPYTYTRAVQMIAAQMRATAQTVQRPTLTVAVTAGGSNLGDATLVVGTTNQYGDQLDTTYGETITATCTSAGTNYGESFGVVGEAAAAVTSAFWPLGSGASTSLTVVNQVNSTLVTDGGFDSWGGTGNNTPQDWDIIDGGAGVTVFRDNDGVRGVYAAKLLSDGSQPTQLGQAVSLSTNTVYAVTVYAKVSASDGSGTLVLSLTDADGNVLDDDAGNALTYSRNMSAQVTTSYQCFTAFFATPRQLPSVVNVQYGFGVAPTAAKYLLLDLAAVVAATQLYAQGPFAAMFAGADPSAVDDTYTVAVTNSLTSQSFVRGSQRVFNLSNLGATAYYPSANSPTISDTLVTH